MPRFLSLLFLIILLAACTPGAVPTATPTPILTVTATSTATAPPTATATPTATAAAGSARTQSPGIASAICKPTPIIRPTLPAKIPGSTQLDPTTNLHITGIYQVIDPATYRLKITGKVDHPLSLSLDELQCMPKVTDTPTLVCPNVFEDTTTWSGVPLAYILDQAGVQSDAQKVILVGADDFKANLTLKEARSPDAYLAYEWKGQPLPILHGFPLRVVLPSLSGGRWVKWLVEIQVQ